MAENNLSIDLIQLSNRSRHALHGAGIHTVGEMLNLDEEAIYKIPNLGKKSVEDILGAIAAYQNMDQQEVEHEASEEIDNSEWLVNDDNKAILKDYLVKNSVTIEALELLSAKAYNILLMDGITSLSDIIFMSSSELASFPRVDAVIAREIEICCNRYITEIKDDLMESKIQSQVSENQFMSVSKMILTPEYRDVIREYVKNNEVDVPHMGLSHRPESLLIKSGVTKMSELLFVSETELMGIKAMGAGSVKEIMNRRNEYLKEHGGEIIAYCGGDTKALIKDEVIRKRILGLYDGNPFLGLNLIKMMERCDLPQEVTEERYKKVVGNMILEGELEYVDYYCYRKYPSFIEFMKTCPKIDERAYDITKKRLNGLTLEAIGTEYNVTRERIRQIIKKTVAKVKAECVRRYGFEIFDEDYYRYLYETYAINKTDSEEWLGLDATVWNYMVLIDAKQGTKDLQEALDDTRNLSAGIRLKIKNYINKDKLYVNGTWVEKSRVSLEKVVAKEACLDAISFDEFVKAYNAFLESNEIVYEENLYSDENVIRTRKNHMMNADYILWSVFEHMRYYDIHSRDYSELLETLNLDSYENIELSTMKFMEDYPDLMEKYDIRDQYELHNLLRKIIQEGSYHDFHCLKMPTIRFGEFDRDAAIESMLMDCAPIAMQDFAMRVHEEFGYDVATIIGSYLTPIYKYYVNGVYIVEQSIMSEDNQIKLKEKLKDDFYYIDEIKKIYSDLIPHANLDEVNAMNLRKIGFAVRSGYVIKNISSMDAYFRDMLTKDEIFDIAPYRRRYGIIQAFYGAWRDLRLNLEIVEFEPDKYINISKLNKSGITKDMLQEFCQEVYDFVEGEVHFSIQSLRNDGFNSELFEYGFSNVFYAGLLTTDSRFSYSRIYGCYVFCKGYVEVSCKSLAVELLGKYGSIDAYDLLTEVIQTYGCANATKTDLVVSLKESGAYYDKILGRLYVNEDKYYHELDEMGEEWA